jgi:hypothetical protein
MFFSIFAPFTAIFCPMANCHILRSVRWTAIYPWTTVTHRRLLTNFRLANAFLSSGVNCRSELVLPLPRVKARNCALRHWLPGGKRKINSCKYVCYVGKLSEHWL